MTPLSVEEIARKQQARTNTFIKRPPEGWWPTCSINGMECESDLSALLEVAREQAARIETLTGILLAQLKEIEDRGFVPPAHIAEARALLARTPVDDALTPREGEG